RRGIVRVVTYITLFAAGTFFAEGFRGLVLTNPNDSSFLKIELAIDRVFMTSAYVLTSVLCFMPIVLMFSIQIVDRNEQPEPRRRLTIGWLLAFMSVLSVLLAIISFRSSAFQFPTEPGFPLTSSDVIKRYLTTQIPTGITLAFVVSLFAWGLTKRWWTAILALLAGWFVYFLVSEVEALFYDRSIFTNFAFRRWEVLKIRASMRFGEVFTPFCVLAIGQLMGARIVFDSFARRESMAKQ
ncbi:MAG: hypothetical protein ABL888_22790, partial [Pirellulaceae bacterium]